MLLLKTLSCGALLHITLSTFCPNEYQKALITISFYLILLYSYAELGVKKIYNHESVAAITKYFRNLKMSREIEIVKFNEFVVSTNRADMKIGHFLLYDFMIYSDYSSSPTNKVLYSGLIKYPMDFNYVCCKFSFISLSVKILNKKDDKYYPIKLSSETENYYIVGNRINVLIIAYLLKKQHGIICDELMEKYELEIIDQDVNIKRLTEKDEIVFNETDYETKPFCYVDTTNMTIGEILDQKNE
jgi:hypothetical protein